MNAEEMQAIADTLRRVVMPNMKPKELLKIVKSQHPKASKKEIARAAFLSIIAHAEEDYGKTKNLQAFAIAARVDDNA
jgi:ERCC4-related helicase